MGVKPIKDKQALTADGEKALPTAAANKVKNLSVGSTGADVVKLQKALGIDADGIFGPQTQQAVINYQKKNGLDPDGIAGELTLGKLYGTTANNTVPPVASNPPTAKPPAANPPAAQPEPEAPAPSAPEAPSKTVTSPAGFTYGDFQYDAWNPQNDPTIQQANTLLQEWLAGKPGDYTPKWQDEADAYLSQYQDRDPFSYDFNSDALYNQYKDQYIQQGRMAMMDTMGQAAALTGGYGNSYAQTVGQQAYNQQLGQLNEIMPELYGMAYDQYTQEGKDMLAMYDLYMGREDQEYGRYQDDLNNWYNQLDYLTQRYDTAYDRGYDDYLRGYNSARSEYDTDRSEAFSKWQMEQENAKSEQKDAYNRLANLISSSGHKPTVKELEAAGMTQAEAKAMQDAYTAESSKPPQYKDMDIPVVRKNFDKAETIEDVNYWAEIYKAEGYNPDTIAAMARAARDRILGPAKPPQTPSASNGTGVYGGTGGGGGGGVTRWAIK